MGCNAVRLSHYPFAPEFYDLCDSLGFYVSNEIFDEWNRGQEWGYSESSYGKMPYTYHLYFDQWGETDLRCTCSATKFRTSASRESKSHKS